jgi:hypothetical protein
MDASRKRLLLYILLNVIVSVCATASVLFVYDRYTRPARLPQAAIVSQPTPASDNVLKMEITTIVGAGVPDSETVILRNTGSDQASLKGWKLQDEDANVYNFADVSLSPGGSIQIHTLAGQDSPIDLYWGQTASIWRSGETATLLDSSGVARSVFQVP